MGRVLAVCCYVVAVGLLVATCLLPFLQIDVVLPTGTNDFGQTLNFPSNQTVFFYVFSYSITPYSSRLGSLPSIGYQFNATNLGFNDDVITNSLYYNLTKLFILHPIVIGVAMLSSVVIGCPFPYKTGRVFLYGLGSLTAVLLMVVWIIDLHVFTTVRTEVIAHGGAASLGAALWTTTAAFGVLVVGIVLSIYPPFTEKQNAAVKDLWMKVGGFWVIVGIICVFAAAGGCGSGGSSDDDDANQWV